MKGIELPVQEVEKGAQLAEVFVVVEWVELNVEWGLELSVRDGFPVVLVYGSAAIAFAVAVAGTAAVAVVVVVPQLFALPKTGSSFG